MGYALHALLALKGNQTALTYISPHRDLYGRESLQIHTFLGLSMVSKKQDILECSRSFFNNPSPKTKGKKELLHTRDIQSDVPGPLTHAKKLNKKSVFSSSSLPDFVNLF